MKLLSGFIVAVFSLLAWPALAQPDLTGTWQGNLEVGPDNQILVQFMFAKNSDGSWSAVLDAPDQPSLTNVAVDGLSLDGTALAMMVTEVSGSYEGEIEGDRIQGTWTQQGTSFPLNLSPYVEAPLTTEQKLALAGSWTGALRPLPNGDLVLNIVFKFEIDDQGELIATFDSPDEGAFGIAIDKVLMVGNELTIEINRARVKYTGSLNNSEIAGNWAQMGQDIELNLQQGEYQMAGLDVPEAARERLMGAWNGKVGPLTVVFRFEQADDGKFSGFLDSPDQGATGIPITELSVNGDDINLGIAAVGGTFVGKISSDALSGDWTQGPVTQQLALNRSN